MHDRAKQATGFEPDEISFSQDGPSIMFGKDMGETVEYHSMTWIFSRKGQRDGRRRWWIFGPQIPEAAYHYVPEWTYGKRDDS